jgi:hypothetical protein
MLHRLSLERGNAMTISTVCRTTIAALLTFGVAVLNPGEGRAQGALPTEGGRMTIIGCLQADQSKFLLYNATMGPIESVPEPTCSVTSSEPPLELDDLSGERDEAEALIGRWVHVGGDLDQLGEDPHDLRELEVSSIAAVPVVVPPPPVAAAIPPPAAAIPSPEVAPQPVQPQLEERPVATTGETQLPPTASPLPLIASIGLVALAVGLFLHLGRRRSLGGE